MTGLLEIVDVLVLLYFAAINAGYTALFIGAALVLVRLRRAALGALPEGARLRSQATIPIALVAPAFNEELTVVAMVRALLSLRYPEHQVIVVNDGSSDGTLRRLREAFALEEVQIDVRVDLPCRPIRGTYRSRQDDRILVVDKENGGKSDALNAGINAARYPLICVLDADTLVVPDALLRMARPFETDPDVIAVGGTIRVANGCRIDRGHVAEIRLPRRWLARFQVVEYLRAFLLGRMGWEQLGGNLIIAGAFGLFRRAALVAAGGYRSDTVGEDMELVVRLRSTLPRDRQAGAIRHLPDPVCFTEVPESSVVLGLQRDRWQRGLADTLWRHRRMIGRPRYGAIGLFVMPFFVVFELLGPVIELGGYLFFGLGLLGGFVDSRFAALFLMAAVLFGFFLSAGGILLEELSLAVYRRGGDLGRLLVYALLENFGYRQLTLFYRVRGLLSFLRGRRAWGKMARTGFGAVRARTRDAPRGRRSRAPYVVGAAALALAALPAAWLLRTPADARVVILDKTVPFEDYREHERLGWLLTHFRVPAPGGGLVWDAARHYVGFEPRAGRGRPLSPEDLDQATVLFITDTYGVYAADLEGGADERSALVYGGLDDREVDAIEAFAASGGRVVAEWNSLGSPTSPEVRARLERLLGVRCSGWTARRFTDLAREDEVPRWLRSAWAARNGQAWDLSGPGLVLVGEGDRVEVLRQDVEVGREPVSLSGPEGAAPWDYWLDVVRAEDPGRIRARFVINATPRGRAVLERLGIPTELPAVVHDDARQRVYLAADFADGPARSMGLPFVGGLVRIRRTMAALGLVPRDMYAFWLHYAPLVEKIVR